MMWGDRPGNHGVVRTASRPVGPTFNKMSNNKNNVHKTDDLRIKEIKELLSPEKIREELPLTEPAAELTFGTRQEIHRILHGANDRLLVIIGPCSIHDPNAALE